MTFNKKLLRFAGVIRKYLYNYSFIINFIIIILLFLIYIPKYTHIKISNF